MKLGNSCAYHGFRPNSSNFHEVQPKQGKLWVIGPQANIYSLKSRGYNSLTRGFHWIKHSHWSNFPDKEMWGGCLVHNIFDEKMFKKKVYFIFDDVISMREMSFVSKNGCMYALDHESYIWWLL